MEEKSAYQLMFEMSIRALASIDEALELPEDGCNNTARTLQAIADLKKLAATGVSLAQSVMGDNVYHAAKKNCPHCGQSLL